MRIRGTRHEGPRFIRRAAAMTYKLRACVRSCSACASLLDKSQFFVDRCRRWVQRRRESLRDHFLDLEPRQRRMERFQFIDMGHYPSH
jgi:hypothetical protein